MAEGTDEVRPEEEEVEGGAIKSFLEHLEDLRWMLIKSGAAVFLAMLVCLFDFKQLVAVLSWPIERAAKRHIALVPEDTNQMVTIQLGDLVLQTLKANSNRLGFIEFGTNQFITVQLDPVVAGTNSLLAVRVITNGAPPANSGPKLSFVGGPGDPFIFSIHVAFFGGLILASPFVLYFVGQFVMPALKIREKKYFMRAFVFGTVLFLGGVSFAYFGVMPAAIKFAYLYAEWMGVNVPFWPAVEYSSFVAKFMLGMGAGFELPVVLLALVKIGVLNYKKLAAMRRYMIVGNLILGALLTTPEVLTQVCMAICLQVLFEVAVWVAWYWERQDKRRAAAQTPLRD
jgi:sec-independent protein translocase protein TatC